MPTRKISFYELTFENPNTDSSGRLEQRHGLAEMRAEKTYKYSQHPGLEPLSRENSTQPLSHGWML